MQSITAKEKQAELKEEEDLAEALRLSQEEAMEFESQASEEVTMTPIAESQAHQNGKGDMRVEEGERENLVEGRREEGHAQSTSGEGQLAPTTPPSLLSLTRSLLIATQGSLADADTEDSQSTSVSQPDAMDRGDEESESVTQSTPSPPSYSQVTPDNSQSSPFSPFSPTRLTGIVERVQRSASPTYSPPPSLDHTPTTTPTTTTTNSPRKKSRKRTRKERERIMTNPFLVTKYLERGKPAMAILGKEFQEDWEVMLLIDTKEPTEMKARVRDRFRGFFSVDFRSLAVGDYIWVACKKKDLPTSTASIYNSASQASQLYPSFGWEESQSERSDVFSQMSAETQLYGDGVPDEDLYVLDWVLERKEILDLAESLGDQRLDRQFRALSRLGLNTIFMVEGDNSAFDYLTDEFYNRIILEGFLAEIEKRQGGTTYNSADNTPNLNNSALFFQQTWKKEETVEFLLEFTNQIRERCKTDGFISLVTLHEFLSFKPRETLKKGFERQLKEIKGYLGFTQHPSNSLQPMRILLMWMKRNSY